MSERTSTYLTSFLVAGCAILALLVVIPAASAAANRIKPGWRAWVWPLVFLSMSVASICDSVVAMKDYSRSDLLGQITVLFLGLTLHWIILNSFYRWQGDIIARVIAPFVWVAFALFVAAQLLSASFFSLIAYEIICAVIITLVYFPLYVKDRDLATDALPILAGLALNVIGAFFNSFDFKINFGLATINNIVIFHLFQAVGIILFLIGGNNSYTVKYAAQRRRERERINH
ncbi:hypothetical protein [Candidatus Chlorohelix sp.]|uniref:DUF6962 family protein n=1 Tax=Candidatus Chlorohelix sp. TaxID=3139201 RepID=UPI003038F557